ncbi:MAG: hypothetical protein PHU34_04790 [Candidatus Methanoperedens sp.]|nr:hypothetical protein [Candidatus Methanoperedens sp.]
MNTPEKIAQAYLRLNGFFTIPHFTLLKDNGTHIDFLAVRLGRSVEKVGVTPNVFPLSIDEQLLSKLAVTKNKTIGIVVEVKGGACRNNDTVNLDEKFKYAKPFFGNIRNIKKVKFEKDNNSEIEEQDDYIIVSIKHCVGFIKNRFGELKRIEGQLERTRQLSKEGSWHLSEEFLSDLIYLNKIEDSTRGS